LAIGNFVLELERIAADKKINTSVFLINKINFAKKKHLGENPADFEEANQITSSMKLMPLAELRGKLKRKTEEYREAKNEAENRIVNFAAQKIMKGSVVFLYGNSPRINKALKLANSKGINFYVYTVDAGPEMSGRKAAEELSNLKIPVRHFPDILASEALSKADILFFEPKAITREGKIIAPMGIKNILAEAKKNKVFSYCVFKKGESKKSSGEKTNQEAKSSVVFVKDRKEEAELSDITAIINEYGIIKTSDFSRIL